MKKKGARTELGGPSDERDRCVFFPRSFKVTDLTVGGRKAEKAKRGQSKLEMEVHAVDSPAPEGVITGGD